MANKRKTTFDFVSNFTNKFVLRFLATTVHSHLRPLEHPFITIWHLQLQKMHLGYFNFGMLGPNVTPNVQHK